MADELDTLLTRGFRYALALTRDAAAAEDLLQDAWLTILKRGGPRHIGYLVSTLRNRYLDLEKRRRLVAIESLDDPDSSALPGIEPRASERDALPIDPADLERGLDTLRPIEREALYLAAVEGYTVAEVADLTGLPLGTMSSLLRRAKIKLRRVLDDDRERRQG